MVTWHFPCRGWEAPTFFFFWVLTWGRGGGGTCDLSWALFGTLSASSSSCSPAFFVPLQSILFLFSPYVAVSRFTCSRLLAAAMGASYSNPLVDSDLVFPAPPSSYSEDTPGLLRLRSSFIPSREVPAFLVRPRVRATTSSSRFSSERGAGGGGSSNASTVACRNASEAPSFLSQHSHVTPRGSPSTLPSVLSSSSPSSFSSASPNAVFFRGARPSVRNFLPRARAPSRLPPPSLSSGTSRTAPQRGNGSCPRPDSNNVVSRFLSSGRRSLPSEGCSGNVRRAGTPTSCFSVRGARCGGAGSSGEHKGAAGQRHPSSAGFEATGAAQPTRGGLFLGSEEPAESAAPHWDASGGSSFLGRKGEGETSALECSGGATFLGQQERKKAEKGFCILYFHGNACDANMMRGWLQLLADEVRKESLSLLASSLTLAVREEANKLAEGCDSSRLDGLYLSRVALHNAATYQTCFLVSCSGGSP